MDMSRYRCVTVAVCIERDHDGHRPGTGVLQSQSALKGTTMDIVQVQVHHLVCVVTITFHSRAQLAAKATAKVPWSPCGPVRCLVVSLWQYYRFNIVNSGSFSSSLAVGRSSGFTSRHRSSKSRNGGEIFSGICGGFTVDAIYAFNMQQWLTQVFRCCCSTGVERRLTQVFKCCCSTGPPWNNLLSY